MDTAGKGGIVRHVVGTFDPQGVHLHAFKAPTDEEKAHDFLWRIRAQLPRAGDGRASSTGPTTRTCSSPASTASSPPEVIEQRYGQIAAFERELVASGTAIVKVMLHISRDEQKRRLARRLDRRDKQWKYNPTDVDERARWDEYMAAYERAIRRTTEPSAPWFVVPADHKWYSRWAVQTIVLDALRGIDPQWPKVDYDVEEEKARLAAT